MDLKRTAVFVIWFVVCHSKVSIDGICNRTEKNEYQQVTVSVPVVFCCSGYEKKTNETCQKCFPGFTSNGTKCERCPERHHGEKCSKECNCANNESSIDAVSFTGKGTGLPRENYCPVCTSSERCDHVTGCVPISSTDVSITHKPGTGIGICIAVALLVFIMFVIVWKYRQSMLKLITCTKAVCSLKRQHDEDNNKTDGYTVIDELYLVEKTLSQKR